MSRTLIRRAALPLAGIIAAFAMVLAGFASAGTANASTFTCTNTLNSSSAPQGCGGLVSEENSLSMAITANNYNAPVTLGETASVNTEDWTVFAVDGLTNDGPGRLGEYVAMYTPDGTIKCVAGVDSCPASGTIGAGVLPSAVTEFEAGPETYCLSVAYGLDSQRGVDRWMARLRLCNGNGVFKIGNSAVKGDINSVSSGHENRYQVWSPVIGDGGLLMVNNMLSTGHATGGPDTNQNYVLDDTAGLGVGEDLIVFQENDQLNQLWAVQGCTQPVSQLSIFTGPYANCP